MPTKARKTNSLQNFRQSLRLLTKNPIAIVTNPYASITSILVMFGALLADRFGSGYGILLLLVLPIFLFGIWSELRKTYLYEHEALPLPVVINIANPASSDDALRSLFQIIEKDSRYHNHRSNLEQYCAIQSSDLIFDYRADIYDSERLKDFLKITRHNLEKLKAKTPRNTVLYLAYIGPASVGILVGTLFGTDGLKIFQYSKSSDSYHEVISIENRKLKESVDKLYRFDIEFPSQKSHENVTVAVDVSSHKIKRNEVSIQTYGDLIYMASRNHGTIDLSEDWLAYSQEIFAVLNSAQNTYAKIRLVYSMPVSLAVALGCALQNYWPIMLTNYDSSAQRYRDVISLNSIQYFF